MAATQIKKEESQAVGVYQLKNGFLPTGAVTKELFDRLFN